MLLCATVGVNIPVPEQWSQGTLPESVTKPVPLQPGQGIVPIPLHVGHSTFANAKLKQEKTRSPISKIINIFLFINSYHPGHMDFFKCSYAVDAVVWVCLNKLRKKRPITLFYAIVQINFLK